MNIDGVKELLEKDKGLSLTLGMEFFSTDDPNTCKATMRVDERNRQPFGFLSGGATLALAENLAGVGSLALCPDDISVGINVSGNHVKAVVEGDTVTARTLVACVASRYLQQRRRAYISGECHQLCYCSRQ